jgi:hypothetical protein
MHEKQTFPYCGRYRAASIIGEDPDPTRARTFGTTKRRGLALFSVSPAASWDGRTRKLLFAGQPLGEHRSSPDTDSGDSAPTQVLAMPNAWGRSSAHASYRYEDITYGPDQRARPTHLWPKKPFGADPRKCLFVNWHE